jgi:hypothetical protein
MGAGAVGNGQHRHHPTGRTHPTRRGLDRGKRPLPLAAMPARRFSPPPLFWYAVIDGPVLAAAVASRVGAVPEPWRRRARRLVQVTLAAHAAEVPIALVLARRKGLGARPVLHTAVVGLPALLRLART